MLSENQKTFIQSNKNIAISIQVISEDMHRSDLKDLNKFEEWLRLENVDETCLGHFLKWTKGLIEDNLQSNLRVKKLMQTMTKDQTDRLKLDEGDNNIN